VLIVHAPDHADAIERRLLAEPAAERIAGVRRVDDNAAVAQHGGGPADEPRLRVLGMWSAARLAAAGEAPKSGRPALPATQALAGG